MAHPYNEHRAHAVEKSRVGAITGMKRGRAVKHSDEPEDKALVKNMVRPEALRADGGAVKQRLDRVPRKKGGRVMRAEGGSAPDAPAAPEDRRKDRLETLNEPIARRARGGAVKGKGLTTVNVIVAPQGQQQKEPVPVPVPGGVAGGPPPAPPPRPAMPPPMPPGAGPGGPGMPPGGPPMMRASGGRAVPSIGMDVGTKVSHSPGKNEKPDQFHTKPPLLTRARGGRAEGGAAPDAEDSRKDASPGRYQRVPSGKVGDDFKSYLDRPMRADGGRIYASETGDHGPNFDAGGGGGFGRLRKAARARSHYHGPVKEA